VTQIGENCQPALSGRSGLCRSRPTARPVVPRLSQWVPNASSQLHLWLEIGSWFRPSSQNHDCSQAEPSVSLLLNTRRPTLLFVVNVPWFFVSHRLPLARAARHAGYNVEIACAPDSGADQLRAEGFTLHFLPLSRSGTPVVGELWALCRLYYRLRPALLHHVTIKPVLLGSLSARLLGITAVVNALPGLGFVFAAKGPLALVRRGLVKWAYRLLLKRPGTRIILQNADDLELFSRNRLAQPGQVVLIRGSGVNLNEFVPTPEPTGLVTVALISRMLKDKGVFEFVAACQLLRNRGLDARFVLVGDTDTGNPAAITRTQLEVWHRRGDVEWWGYRSDIAAVMRSVHVICLPSYREGLPKVLIEAAASARVIVTTDTPGCREVVTDGDNGLLVPSRDFERLAAAMETLITDSALRQKMGRRGRERAEAEFGVQKVIDRTLRLYQELVAP